MTRHNCECRILVVDDDASVGKLMCEILKSDGYTVSSVLSGQEAISRIKNADYHIIFVDYLMPNMNGLETIKAIKSIKPKTRAVLISGMRADARQDVNESIHSGLIDEYLEKPFFRTKLKETVSRYFNA